MGSTGTEITYLIPYSDLLLILAIIKHFNSKGRDDKNWVSHHLTPDVDLKPLSVPVISNLCSMWSTVAYCWPHLIAGSAPVLCSELQSFLEYLLSQSILMSFPGEVYILCSKELRYGRYKPNWCRAAAVECHRDGCISSDTAALLVNVSHCIIFSIWRQTLFFLKISDSDVSDLMFGFVPGFDLDV